MTLYKWWPSPGPLALEAYFAAVEVELGFDDTGDLIEANGGRVIGELVGLAQSDPALASAVATTYTRPRR